MAAPRQLDQPRLRRREPDAPRGRRWPRRSAAWSWSTSGSAAAPCSTRSPPGRMRDTPADLISVKIGINLVNTDLMRLRAFGPAVHGFLDTIREGHPTTPLLVVSPDPLPDPRGHPRPRAAGPQRPRRGPAGLPGHRRPRGPDPPDADRRSATSSRTSAPSGRRRPAPALPRRSRAVRRGGRRRAAAARRAPPRRRHAPAHRRAVRGAGLRRRRTLRRRWLGPVAAVPSGSAITLAASYSVSIGVSGPTLRW